VHVAVSVLKVQSPVQLAWFLVMHDVVHLVVDPLNMHSRLSVHLSEFCVLIEAHWVTHVWELTSQWQLVRSVSQADCVGKALEHDWPQPPAAATVQTVLASHWDEVWMVAQACVHLAFLASHRHVASLAQPDWVPYLSWHLSEHVAPLYWHVVSVRQAAPVVYVEQATLQLRVSEFQAQEADCKQEPSLARLSQVDSQVWLLVLNWHDGSALQAEDVSYLAEQSVKQEPIWESQRQVDFCAWHSTWLVTSEQLVPHSASLVSQTQPLSARQATVLLYLRTQVGWQEVCAATHVHIPLASQRVWSPELPHVDWQPLVVGFHVQRQSLLQVVELNHRYSQRLSHMLVPETVVTTHIGAAWHWMLSSWLHFCVQVPVLLYHWQSE
jgi:hypothetical protein